MSDFQLDIPGRVIARSARSLTVRARAKVNLTLRVCGKLDSGYHFLQSVVCPLSLRDRVSVTAQPEGRVITCTTKCTAELFHHLAAAEKRDPALTELIASLSSPKNLAAKAAELMFRELNLPGAVSIEIEKSIPFQAGLGGGSADAAAVIFALDQLFALHLPAELLFEIGAQIGSDVPALLADRLVLMTGRGEVVTPVRSRTGAFAQLPVLIVKPIESVSTAHAYSLLDLATRISDSNIAEFGPESKSAQAMLLEQSLELAGAYEETVNDDKQLTLLAEEGISGGPILGPRQASLPRFTNDFQPVILGHYTEIRAACEELAAEGAGQALLAGSGSAVVGIFGSAAQAAAAGHKLRADASKGWFVSEATLEP